LSGWKTENWWVSHLNFIDEIRSQMSFPEKVLVHDITLRDGEQQAGVVFTKEDKLQIARMLDEVGVHRIEAGMPAVSPEDKQAIKAIANDGLHAKVFCFSRCMKSDVDLALECDVDGVIMEIPASQHIIKYAYNWPVEKAIKLPVEATDYAARHGLEVAFFTIDSTRADLEWWFKIINSVATEGHMDSIVLVDTFGVCNPEAIAYFVKRVREKFDKPIEVHCHNDFGLATANTIAAVLAGAEIVHTTVNAIGERVGNASLEEVCLALEVLYGLNLGLKYEKLYALSKLVEKLSKINMPPHKPIVGDGAFKTESGIVSSWWLRVKELDKPLIMMPFTWELVGQKPFEIILGKKSGKDSIVHKLKELGMAVPEENIEGILESVKSKSYRRKGPVPDEIFKRIVEKKRAKTVKEPDRTYEG